MANRDPRLDEARQRALIITGHIRQRLDFRVRDVVDQFEGPLTYADQLETLAIASEAWAYVQDEGIDPKCVFAHPAMLQERPEVSLYYRGLATLSLKRVQTIASSVKNWEEGSWSRKPPLQACLRVARLYNAVISFIILGSERWTLDNGYRNVLATIGITEDGKLRNIVGQEGEQAIKDVIAAWLQSTSAIQSSTDGGTTLLGSNADFKMVYGSEPDISFQELRADGQWQIVATIEIKSGTDPAGALERLGAIQKSFEETPARSRNFAVFGVVTPEMRRRLNGINMARDFSLYDILNDQQAQDDFIQEIFHHTLRLL